MISALFLDFSLIHSFKFRIFFLSNDIIYTKRGDDGLVL